MKPRPILIAAVLIAWTFVAFTADQPKPADKEIYFPHEHVQKVTITEADIPFEKKLVLKENDAIVFILPDKKTFSVWCYRMDDRGFAAEQTTKSGLKTSWAEKPWIQLRSKWKDLGGGSYQGDGYDSYIEHGGVSTRLGETSDYTLYIHPLKISIIEDLKATNNLPVTIRMIKSNRPPKVSPPAE
ncbi:MAG: hypothetical protein ACO1QS_18265 [Verrucomicrobiota bacterium]